MSRSSTDTPSVTIVDVASAANVSIATVSRVLNGSAQVRPATRQRVLDAVEQTGFRVNRTARGLRTSRSYLVGLLVPSIGNEVFGQIAESVDHELSQSGLGMIIGSLGWDPSRQRSALEQLDSRGVDAFIVSLVDDREPLIAERLRALSQPLVLLDRDVRGVECDTVLTDQAPGFNQAIDHLVALGCKSIGLVAMPRSARPGRQVLDIYRRALRRHGLEYRAELVVPSEHFDAESGRHVVDRLVAAKVDGIIAGGPMALVAGVLERLEERRIRIPDDLLVITYDDTELASIKRPKLSVIARPLDELGRRAAALIVRRLLQPDAPIQTDTVPTHLVVRESTTPRARTRAAR